MAWLRYSTTSAPPRRPRRLPRTVFQRLAAASVQRHDHAAERRILEDAVQRGLELVQEPRREGSPPQGRLPRPGRHRVGREPDMQHLGRKRRFRAPAARFRHAKTVGAEARRSACWRSQSEHGTSRSRMRKTPRPGTPARAPSAPCAPVEQVGARHVREGEGAFPEARAGLHRRPSARRARSARRCKTSRRHDGGREAGARGSLLDFPKLREVPLEQPSEHQTTSAAFSCGFLFHLSAAFARFSASLRRARPMLKAAPA